MDRDLALQTSAVLTSIKNKLDDIAEGTVPASTQDSINLSDTRSLDSEEIKAEPEETETKPEEPETTTRKKSTSK